MRIIIFYIFCLTQVFAQQIYKGQNHSQINWETLDTKEWLDFSKWREGYDKLSKVSLEDKALKHGAYREIVGYVLHCLGECRNYRDYGYSFLSYQSPIREGDEVATQEHSYMWVYLVDGTMVRLSPDSSITLREINISDDDFFFQTRINYGNVFWMARSYNFFEEQNLRETDVIFDPLPIDTSEENQNDVVTINDDNLYELLDRSNEESSKYIRLNKLIENNNKLLKKQKRSFALLVMPNGSVFGDNLICEFYVLAGDKSYFKIRSSLIYNQNIQDTSNAKFYFRGYENDQELHLQTDQWFVVSDTGEEVTGYDGVEFGMGELMTKRIPTILMAREHLFARYSIDFFLEKLNKTRLALDYGYRLWKPLEEEDSDSQKRFSFLKNFTRRIETTNILMAKKLKKMNGLKYHAQDEFKASKFFIDALNSYQRRPEISRPLADREILNSTTKPLWKRISRRLNETPTDPGQ